MEVASSPQLSTLLQSLVRPADQVDITHLEALGVLVRPDVSLSDLIPDSSCFPSFDEWDTLSQEDAHAVDAESRRALCDDRLSPGASKYVDLRQGLLTDNDRAFRAVRRLAQKPGEQYVRLGYCHDFFRSLETLTSFWDDTAADKPSIHPDEKMPIDGGESAAKSCGNDQYAFYRTSAGTSMPPQYRTQLLTSFLRLVTYDFSCSVTSRQEPRLYIKSPAPGQKHSNFTSGCSFIYRMPLDREFAKRGIIEGPLAAVSPRHATLPPRNGRDRDSVIDLSREVIAALITAQQRSREGREEERIGQGAWWTTTPRWGGGPGGPIGKEAEALESKDPTAVVVGDKDERPGTSGSVVEGDPSTAAKDGASSGSSSRSSSSRGSSSRNSGGSSPTQPPHPKRPRKGLAIYDAYRMVRPPSKQWDPKTKYAAIGRQRGVDYDDVFVISCLYHHISILRVRVPDRLLDVLSGAIPDPGVQARGRLDIWRTRWYDFFVAEDRVEAMKAVWAVMAYAMRKQRDVVGDEESGKDLSSDGEAKKKGSKK